MNTASLYKKELTFINPERFYIDHKSTNYNREYLRKEKRYARKVEVRRHIIQLILTICVILSIILFINHSVSNANTGEKAIYFKYYTTIEIQPGETLTTIAFQYADDIHYASISDYMQEVAFINHIEDVNEIKAGSYLTVPYYSTEYK